MKEVNEAGEFKSGSMAENIETYGLKTFGRLFGISRQALVNDDLNSFSSMARKMGFAAAEFENAFLLNKITSNPVMNDKKTLFHADHNNIAIAAALNVTSIGDMKKLMRLQKGLDNKTPVNAIPAFILAPANLEAAGEEIIANIYPTTASEVNPFSGKLELLVEPRLDAVNEEGYYLFSDPLLMPVLQYAYLSGAEGPQIFTQEGFNTDGMEFKVRTDFGAGVIEHRGAVYNQGV